MQLSTSYRVVRETVNCKNCFPPVTGYIGKPLIEKLLADGFGVTAVARPRSSAKLPIGCVVITGKALDSRTYEDQVPPGSTSVHLMGTPHPAPWKAAQFRSIDLVSRTCPVPAP